MAASQMKSTPTVGGQGEVGTGGEMVRRWDGEGGIYGGEHFNGPVQTGGLYSSQF